MVKNNKAKAEELDLLKLFWKKLDDQYTNYDDFEGMVEDGDIFNDLELLEGFGKFCFEEGREEVIREIKEAIKNMDWSADAKNSVLEMINCFDKKHKELRK